jgi:hypothetical protein
MAIVRANYTRNRAKIKATLRYIIHRPGREGEKLTRILFGHDGALSKEGAYQLIDAQKGLTYFHLKMNFHPTREDTRKDLNLREITRQTIATLEKRFQRIIRFLAVEHNDHTQLRHIHAIVILKLARGERIGWVDWKACREVATEQVLLQRRALDIVPRVQQERSLTRQPFLHPSIGKAGGRAKATRYRRPLQPNRACPECAYINQMVKLKSGRYWCPIHGLEREQRLQLEQERSLELSRQL